jgi:adenine deaminase
VTSPNMTLSGNLVDLFARRVYAAVIEVRDGRIASITEQSGVESTYLLPGLVDAHVHIESSMLVPSEFARAAVVHGTVASVSDPHEIANVLGVDGVRFMLDNAAGIPFRFYFGAPSCVPATPFETAGDTITVAQVEALLADPRILYLSEMMNFPGVLSDAADVMAKLAAARRCGKPVDGHAPGLRGSDAKAYIEAGISTDHECCTREEAEEKIGYGAKISIREGSAARNFDALCGLIDDYPDDCFLCSDDKHPDDLQAGHIDRLVRRAVARGIDCMNVLRVACMNPVRHYGLDVGLLREGDRADLIEVDNLRDFRVLRTFVGGTLVAERGQTLIERRVPSVVNRFAATPRSVADFRVTATATQPRTGNETTETAPFLRETCSDTSVLPPAINVIEAADGQLVTRRLRMRPKVVDRHAVSDPDRDILKMAVVNRYQSAPPAMAFIKNMGLKQGAIASSVAHDSHNVIAVGTNDEDLCAAVNLVIEAGGGLAVAEGADHQLLPLPIAGLMSAESYDDVGTAYANIDRRAKRLGSPLRAPFMTLSFMALLVIPEIKLSDRGLFDGQRFEFLPLFV